MNCIDPRRLAGDICDYAAEWENGLSRIAGEDHGTQMILQAAEIIRKREARLEAGG